MSFETQFQPINGEQQTTTTTQKKQQIVVPPMRYDLKQATGQTVLNHLIHLMRLRDLSKPFDKMADYTVNFMQKLQNQHPAKMLTFGYIPAPPHSEITRRVIGIDGYFFKMTTTVSGIDLIWHDRENNTFLFWGTTIFNVVKAMNSIRWRIHKCYTTLPPKRVEYQDVEEISDDEEDNASSSSMPELIDADDNVISVGSVPDYEMSSVD